MTRRVRCLLATLALTSAAPLARADEPLPLDGASDAELFFEEGKALRAEGNYPAACDAFAQSKLLAPGVGVSLHLADCYEHVGKSASAWAEFRDAETLARGRKDKRASVAQKRAAALEAHLSRLRVRIVPTAGTGAEVKIDGGAALSIADLSGVPVDPGDHRVTMRTEGLAARSASAHVEPGTTVTVTFDVTPPPPPSPRPAPALLVAGRTPALAPAPPSPSLPMPPLLSPQALLECYLVAAGVIGVGAGAAFLVVKNNSESNGSPNGQPVVDGRAAAASDVAFGIGGAALATALIVYLATPSSKDAALVVAPTPLIGGAGAFVRARF
jgi:serine/threonine-protein kinase